MLFNPEEDISFSPLSKLIEGKWRRSLFLRMGALFFVLSRLTVTPRSELRPVKLLALLNCYGAPPAFPVFIKMSW